MWCVNQRVLEFGVIKHLLPDSVNEILIVSQWVTLNVHKVQNRQLYRGSLPGSPVKALLKLPLGSCRFPICSRRLPDCGRFSSTARKCVFEIGKNGHPFCSDIQRPHPFY